MAAAMHQFSPSFKGWRAAMHVTDDLIQALAHLLLPRDVGGLHERQVRLGVVPEESAELFQGHRLQDRTW
jgi:hypothetical protein